MGLNVTFTGQKHPYSMVADPLFYGRIVEVNMNLVDYTARVVMHLYESKAARDAGGRPVQAIGFDFNQEEVTDADGNVLRPSTQKLLAAAGDQLDAIKSLLYPLLKSDPNLAGMETEDVIEPVLEQ